MKAERDGLQVKQVAPSGLGLGLGISVLHPPPACDNPGGVLARSNAVVFMLHMKWFFRNRDLIFFEKGRFKSRPFFAVFLPIHSLNGITQL